MLLFKKKSKKNDEVDYGLPAAYSYLKDILNILILIPLQILLARLYRQFLSLLGYHKLFHHHQQIHIV